MATNVDSLLEKAVQEVDNIYSGEEFKVKDLFKGYEWRRIPLSKRLLLGTLFLNYVNSAGGNLIATEKTASKQQQYKKI